MWDGGGVGQSFPGTQYILLSVMHPRAGLSLTNESGMGIVTEFETRLIATARHAIERQNMKTVTLLIIGAGQRGRTYAEYASEFPHEARIVGVADPLEGRRRSLAELYGIPEAGVADDWRDLARRKRFADAVVIGTQDSMHAAPAIAFARKGYHILLEKPMAPTPRDCRRIAKAVVKAGVLFSVGHVLRYTPWTQAMRKLLDSGAVGDVVSVDHLEPVGFWRHAHSYVRGPWSREGDSSPMLLAKSCHDIDWLRYIVGSNCRAVSSFGSLKHFRREEAPAGAADRCLDCVVEPGCCYSAKKMYLGAMAAKMTTRMGHLVSGPATPEAVAEALRTGPYGRCVYACDNDVVDHQVVNLSYESGATATFTMAAFNDGSGRKTRIFCTKGEIRCDGPRVEVYDFLTDAVRPVEMPAPAPGATGLLSRHDGGDLGLMQAFVRAVAAGDRSLILSGAEETLETHLTVFAAEKARRTGRVVKL